MSLTAEMRNPESETIQLSEKGRKGEREKKDQQKMYTAEKENWKGW